MQKYVLIFYLISDPYAPTLTISDTTTDTANVEWYQQPGGDYTGFRVVVRIIQKVQFVHTNK